jgi:two-component system chemotaxis response regulator CheY
MRVTILVVDHAPIFVQIIRRMLEDLPVDIIEAAGPAEALAFLAICRPDLVILDPTMAGEACFQVIEAAGRRKEVVTVLVLSGDWTEEDRARARAAGAAAVWEKPLDARVFRMWLVARVLQALARKIRN